MSESKEVRLEMTHDGAAPVWRIVYADSGAPTYAGFSNSEQNAHGLAHRHHYAVVETKRAQLRLI